MSKISPAFAARLQGLQPEEQARVVLMFSMPDTSLASGRASARARRPEVIEAMRRSAEPALHDVDAILAQVGGKRLRASIDALGCVPVETTTDGIRALAELDRIAAIVEDQSISLLHTQ
jgi:hypothetical protein